MSISIPHWPRPLDYLKAKQPDTPVYFFAPSVLHQFVKQFQQGFNGLTTFAVKANPDPVVITNLVTAGLNAFDVASPEEISLIRDLIPGAALHYNNPIRSRSELAFARDNGVKSFSVDCLKELAKIAALIPAQDVELSVRLKLPVQGAAYNFGEKFGADPGKAVKLLQAVVALGYRPSMTFHPGTQCHDPEAWGSYITKSAEVAEQAGITLHRLNVGGGFPSHRNGNAPDLTRFFQTIDQTVAQAFGDDMPALVCEPGRAMVAGAFALAPRVKAIGEDGAVYLNDGKYGGLADFADMGVSRRFQVFSSTGEERKGSFQPRVIFGPTCDSLDVMPGKTPLPGDIAEEDYILFQGMGAYVNGMTTPFNGYGDLQLVTVAAL